MIGPKVFYASGTRGQSVRADGNGGTMAKGWYARTQRGVLFGPFTSERKAGDSAEAAA